MRYSTVPGLPAAALFATGGAVALTTGWVVPRLRGSVVRPELWGVGALVFGAGMATGISVQFFAGSAALDDALMAAVLVQVIVGAVLQGRAQRRPRPTATESVS